MKIKSPLLAVIFSAILITSLFYNQGIGLNLLFFEFAFFVWLLVSNTLKFKSHLEKICSIGLLLTAVFTVINYSVFTYIIHFLALFLFIGVLNYSKARSLVSVCIISLESIFAAQKRLLNELVSSKAKGKNVGSILWKSRIFVTPVFIILFFITLYSFSNPIFSDLVVNIGNTLQKGLNYIFEDIDFPRLFTFILSLAISAMLILRVYRKKVESRDQVASEFLVRKRTPKPRYFKLPALKNEYKAGVFLLFILNIILLIVNAIDIYWVWFNFEWEGQTLKQFVHAGTYLLIFSILISIAVVLYFFRGNLNFYYANKWLKNLAYIWLLQNGILAISVGVRNFRYIEYFALAYKRIGVIVFLALTLYGLYTVFKKIQESKSSFYLFKSNAMALYVVLVFCALINWDNLIARYNFANADKSYVELKFMSNLADKSLPYLDLQKESLTRMDSLQEAEFNINNYKMTPSEYQTKIRNRKLEFKSKWESKNLLSWNLSENRAYRKLFQQ
jgi:hypothetical protein